MLYPLFADSCLFSCAALGSRSPVRARTHPALLTHSLAREVFAPPPTAPCFHSSLNIQVIPGTGEPSPARRSGRHTWCKARVDVVSDVGVVQWRSSFLHRQRHCCRKVPQRTKQSSAGGKNSHIQMFSLKTSQTFEISFHPEMHHNVLLVLLRPSSERWLQGTPRPEDLRRGRRWVDSVEAQQCTGKSIPQNPLAPAKVNIHQGIRYQSFPIFGSANTMATMTTRRARSSLLALQIEKRLIMNVGEIKMLCLGTVPPPQA